MKNNDKFNMVDPSSFGMPNTPSLSCPRCQVKMQRLYLRVQEEVTKKRSYVGVGWYCPNPLCNQILRDE